MGAEGFELACGLFGCAAHGGEFDGGFEGPPAFGGQTLCPQQLGEAGERHETDVDETALADVAAQVEASIGCWYDDGDGCEGVSGLMFMQEAFKVLLGLLDVYDMGGGLLHV